MPLALSRSSPQFQSIQEWEDTFLALFSHRHDYIWAAHPQPTAKPQWQTESRHPLSDRLILQGGYLGLSRHKGKKVPDGLEALSRLSLRKAIIR